MLEVERKKEPQIFNENELKENDIIVTRTKIEITYNNEGQEIRTRKKEKINLTKKINETKKLLNTYSAEEKIAELEKIFTKKGE